MKRAALVWLAALLVAGCGGGRREEAVSVPEGAKRIVSLAPNLTEILFALELGDQVVGVTDYCNYPPEAQEKPRVGGFVNPNLEIVVGLEPDLALATPNIGNKEAVVHLRSLGIDFLIVETPSLAALYDSIRKIADRAGVPENGKALAGEIEAEVEAIREQLASAPPTSTLLVFSHDPLIVAGPETFFDEMVSAAGGRNLAEDAGMRYPQFSLEEVVRRAPETIIDTAMGSGGADGKFWERWPTIPAVRDGRICTPPPDPVLRPGPRILEGLRLLAECLHPGALDEDGA